MFFTIDPHNGVAIYEQIVRQISFAVAGNLLHAGDLVPSVRELARQLAVNPNTVSRAYRQLQSDGILEPLRGTGLAVAATAAKQCRTARVRLLRERIAQVIREAKQSRLEPEEVRKLVEEELATLES